jgi:signal transduction histidine kinase
VQRGIGGPIPAMGEKPSLEGRLYFLVVSGEVDVLESKDQAASAIRRAQAELAQALSDLEKTSAFDPGSVAFVAHSLNNFLVVTSGTVEMLRIHLGDLADAQAKAWLDGLDHATALMTRTVRQLVNASASIASQLQFDRVDLPLLVRRACTYFQQAADRKGIRLVVETDEALPPVCSDRVVLAAVLENLVSNAMKYSPSGKQVHVRVRGEENFGICEVCDEGPGLSEADQSRLFQRGARLTPIPTAGEPSTGYGLAVAKELIEKLGGTIWCVSTLGKGSCFGFRIPVFVERKQ